MHFSIIIPAKNELANLKRTLPQYRALDRKYSYELIVADGASTDGTIEYAKSMGARVEVKTKPERETIGEGRNRGAAVARGDVLLFIDAGVIVPDLVAFALAIDKAFFDRHVVAAVPRVVINPAEATLMDRLVHGMVNTLIWIWNLMGWGAGKGETQIVRHDAFKAVHGYNQTLVAAEDNDLYRRLARIGKIKTLRDISVYDDPARYRQKGYVRVISLWLANQLFVRIFGKSFSKEWKRAS